jgi:glycosyltransferase involved in cell wall biosynthesis
MGHLETAMLARNPGRPKVRLKPSVIIPAHNEAGYIGACLSALLNSTGDRARYAEIVVVANACTDQTAAIARGFRQTARSRGWDMKVLECETPGKLNALNLGDAASAGALRVYLDADVTVSPALIDQIIGALDTPAPAYAGGEPRLAPATSWVTRAYGRFWRTLPFFANGVPGFGVFAVNAAGRSRWGAFPDIISDDTFVRLQFAPHERRRVQSVYTWPMVEGISNLVRVRRRQDAGVAEIARIYPALLANDAAGRPGVWAMIRRGLCDPAGFLVYAAVSLAVRLPAPRAAQRWARGR